MDYLANSSKGERKYENSKSAQPRFLCCSFSYYIVTYRHDIAINFIFEDLSARSL